MKNHLGQYECKLCLTIHNTEVWPVTYIILYTIVDAYNNKCN